MITTLDGIKLKSGDRAWEIGIGEGHIYRPTHGHYQGKGNSQRLINPQRCWSTREACQEECDRKNMKAKPKHVVILGHSRTRRYNASVEIEQEYESHEAVRLEYDEKAQHNEFFFHECTPETKLIIFEAVTGTQAVQRDYQPFDKSICVHKQGHEAFTIYPRLVFICSSHVKQEHMPKSKLFAERFEIRIMA